MALAVGGVAELLVNGRQVSVKGNVKVNLGQPRREALEVATGPVGYKQRAGTPSVEFETILDAQGLSLEEISQLSGVPITVRLNDGTTYALESAWAEGEWSLDTEEITIPAMFKALRAVEVRP